jgi:tRNA A58 N-methylase Trm61
MPVDVGLIAEVRAMLTADEGSYVPSTLAAFQSIPEIAAYVVEMSRAEGFDEADMVEAMVRAGDYTPADVRKIERVLRPLGYVVACDRLRKVAGKRRDKLSKLSIE